MNSAKPLVLTINGGSSSIKFAFFETGDPLLRVMSGQIERIGQEDAALLVTGVKEADNFSRPVTAPDHTAAVNALMDWIEERAGVATLAAIGHRVVHGGPAYSEPQRITAGMVEKLRGLSPFDPEHLPEEILLTEAFHRRFSALPQVACFDTAFHHNFPRIAQVLPIPRYEAQGVRRYGFHGLSYTFLLGDLEHQAGEEAAKGRVVLAHLGTGASLAAVREGKAVDTSMSFTPTAGVPMSTRSGDLDPGLHRYLERTDGLDGKGFSEMVNFESGLLGVSETSSDMRELLDRESQDVRAAEAISLFCYQIKKWIGSFAAALSGLDTIVFFSGIAAVRAQDGDLYLFLPLVERESIWISYSPMPPADLQPHQPRLINSHHRLAAPVAAWERLKIGGGTPPVLTRHGWLILYHGVRKSAEPDKRGRELCYSAGVMILSVKHPQKILYRSPEPVLTPESPEELEGTISNVVFPTGIDRRDDLGTPDRFDVYYGMADSRIGVARLNVPKHLPARIRSRHSEAMAT